MLIPTRAAIMSTAVAAMAIATLAAGPVSAQTPGWDWLPKDWQVGGSVLVVPRYEGARGVRAIGLPFIAPVGTGDGRLQFKGPDDVRLRLVTWEGFELGPVAGWRFGRDDSADRRLRGLGDIDGGLALGGYAAYRLGPMSIFAAYSHQATGDETGGLLRVGIDTSAQVQPWLKLTALAGATWASEDYMRSYFSVTPAQAARSGLAIYNADSGFKDVHAGLGAAIPLADRWTLRLDGRYTHLIGAAGDSPIVESQSQWSGMAGLSYRLPIRP